MAGKSPTQRTLAALKQRGQTTGIVERWLQHAGPYGQRKDLFGFIDIISLDPGRGIVGVQCCARSGHAAHRKKIIEECTDEVIEWLKCGGHIEIWSWAKQKIKRGGVAERWTPKVEAVTLRDFE